MAICHRRKKTGIFGFAFKPSELIKPGPTTLAISKLVRTVSQIEDRFNQDDHEDYDDREVSQELTRIFPVGFPCGTVQIASGDKNTLAISNEQASAIAGLFSLDYSALAKGPLLVKVQTLKDRDGELIEDKSTSKATARLYWADSLVPKSLDHLVISQALATELGAEDEITRILICEAFQLMK